MTEPRADYATSTLPEDALVKFAAEMRDKAEGARNMVRHYESEVAAFEQTAKFAEDEAERYRRNRPVAVEELLDDES